MSSEDKAQRITLTKINDTVIKPMKVKGGSDSRPIKGTDLFPEVYANIFCCARKRSGKTIAIQTILKKCLGPNTTVLAFCSTINKDNAWLSIRAWCKKHSIPFEGFSSVKEDKVDTIDAFIHRLEQEAEEEPLDDSDEEEPVDKKGRRVPRKMSFFPDNEQDSQSDYEEEEYEDERDDDNLFREKAPSASQQRLFSKRNKTSLVPKDKFIAPEFILIFDDLSNELKLPSIVSLLKKNRHYKLKIIISSQYLNDLKPESIRQCDYILIFKGMGEEKLQKILIDADLSIDLPTFIKLYKDATEELYSFLYVDVRNDAFRKKFDKLYKLEG